MNSINSIISEKTSQFIYIDKMTYGSISKFFIRNVKRSELENFIIQKISNDGNKITSRNIEESFTQEKVNLFIKPK